MKDPANNPAPSLPPATIAERVARRNGLTDITKKGNLPASRVTPPPAALPPKKA